MRMLILFALSLTLTPAAAAPLDPRGVWMVEDKSAQIEIENCAGILWGIVLWERNAGRDTQNPDPGLRGRPTLGIPILLGMRSAVPQGGDRSESIWRGHIYNARNGQTYDANLKQREPDVLQLEGCVLGGLFCGGQNWTRVKVPAAAPRSAADVCSRVADLTRGTH